MAPSYKINTRHIEMRVFDFGGLPTSLGEIINFKWHLDLVRPNYDKIVVSFHTDLLKTGLHSTTPDWAHKQALWNKYLTDIGQLFFSEPPYERLPTSKKFGGDITHLIAKLHLRPRKAELGHLLCRGTPLNIGEYVVITTKTREIQRAQFDQIAPRFWEVMKAILPKYKIVILGEKKVEIRKEYERLRIRPFGLYDDIIKHLPPNTSQIVDLTVPALGEVVSDLKQIQQDCLIMQQAKFVISFGIGGNHCLSTAVSNMAIGYRTDNVEYNNTIFDNKEYPNAIITKDADRFLGALKYYV